MKFFSDFLCFVFLLTLTTVSWGDEKTFLKCEGAGTVGATNGKNITNDEFKFFTKLKSMSLRVIIDGARIDVNGYEYKDISTTFPDEKVDKFEHGHLTIKDTYYDGYYSLERYESYKNSDKPMERNLYFYQRTRFILSRLNGDFTWQMDYFGQSWLNDLLSVKPKDKYVHLEVNGKCKKDSVKILF